MTAGMSAASAREARDHQRRARQHHRPLRRPVQQTREGERGQHRTASERTHCHGRHGNALSDSQPVPHEDNGVDQHHRRTSRRLAAARIQCQETAEPGRGEIDADPAGYVRS